MTSDRAPGGPALRHARPEVGGILCALHADTRRTFVAQQPRQLMAQAQGCLRAAALVGQRLVNHHLEDGLALFLPVHPRKAQLPARDRADGVALPACPAAHTARGIVIIGEGTGAGQAPREVGRATRAAPGAL